MIFHWITFTNASGKIWQQGSGKAYTEKNQNIEILSRFYVVQAMSILDHKIFPLDSIPLNEIFDTHLKYFIYGIATPEGTKQFEKLIQKKGI